MAASDLSSPLRRKIQFKPSIRIREFVDDKDESHKQSIWYTDEEYDQMEAANTEVVNLMIQNCSPTKRSPKDQRRTLRQLIGSTGHTERGLEKMTPEAWDRTQDIRDEACNAVFREQARQQEQRIYDPLAISTVYQRACSRSKREATDSGLRDERFISKEFGPLEPTGIKPAAVSSSSNDKDKDTIPSKSIVRRTRPQGERNNNKCQGSRCGSARALPRDPNIEQPYTAMEAGKGKTNNNAKKSSKPDPV